MPATSENLTFGASSAIFFARLLPNCICLLFAPFICDRKKMRMPKIRTSGSNVVSSVVIQPDVVTSTLYEMLGCFAIISCSESSPM